MEKDTSLITLKIYVLICFFSFFFLHWVCFWKCLRHQTVQVYQAWLFLWKHEPGHRSSYLSSLRPPPALILLITCDNFKCLSIYLHVVNMKIPSDLNCWSNLGLTMRGHTDIRLHASWLFYCSPVCCNTSRWQIYPAFYGILWKSGAIFVWKKLNLI